MYHNQVDAYVTDLPLICDDVLALRLSALNIQAIVLSNNLLDLWHIRSLVYNDTARLVSKAKELPVEWSLSEDKTNLTRTKDADYLAEIRISNCYVGSSDSRGSNNMSSSDNDDTDGICLNSESSWDRYESLDVYGKQCRALPRSLRVLPVSKVRHFLYHNPGSRVILFDLPGLYANDALRNLPNVMFAFTRPFYDCERMFSQRQRYANNDAGDGNNSHLRAQDPSVFRGRDCWTALPYFLNNDALLPNDHVFRFQCILSDPNDSLFWRNLLVQLLWSNVAANNKSSDEKHRITVLITLVGFNARDYNAVEKDLTQLRFKRFLAFFARTIQSLQREKAIASRKWKPMFDVYWTVLDRDRERVYKLVAEIYDEAIVAKGWSMWRNRNCYVTGDADNNMVEGVKRDEKRGRRRDDYDDTERCEENDCDDTLPDIDVLSCDVADAMLPSSWSSSMMFNQQTADQCRKRQRSSRPSSLSSVVVETHEYEEENSTNDVDRWFVVDNSVGLVHESLFLRGFREALGNERYLLADGYSVVALQRMQAPLLKFQHYI